jgi:hypothetical protein
MVQVSAITGIPTAQPNTDKPSIDRYDDMQRETYYASLLADPRMQPRARPDGTLAPVCESELASATPAPRLVEFARRYGAEANVQSICEPDWAAAVLEMLTRDFALQRVGECSSRHWPRSSEGLAACRVLWELPPAGFAPMGTPAHCAERPFLTPATAMSHGENGGELCEVRQLAVRMSGDMRSVEPGEGWFYDDFSVLPQCGCRGSVCNQTVFVPYAPPSGVTMKIECQETQCLEPGCDPSECRVPG